MAEIASAMRDKYPGWQVQEPISKIIRPLVGDQMTVGDPCRHAVLCFAYEPRNGLEEKAAFLVSYPEYDERTLGGRAA